MSRTINRTKYNDSWMYILLLSTLVILAESLKTYNFQIKGINLTYVIFILPFIYMVTNYITKKYGFRRTLIAIFVSAISLISFILLMNFAIGRTFDISNIVGGLLGYLISQMVNTIIYKFLLVNTNSPYLLIVLNYIFTYIVFYMLYTIVYINIVITDTFWISYFITLAMQTIISIGLAFLDKKIKVGMSKDD